MVWLSLIIPFLMGIILVTFFRHKVVWWELIIPVVATVIIAATGKWLACESLMQDVEYRGGYAIETRYYEPWNERVSCRHPIRRTRCSGFGKSRRCHTVTVGYYHPYDVDYHPARWEVNTSLGEYSISEDRYHSLLRQFQVSPTFKELHRSYHTIDGDMYFGMWDGRDATLEPIVKANDYSNRPRASVSIYHYNPLDTMELKLHKPFDYPAITNTWHQQAILGFTDPVAERKMQILNSRLGAPNRVKAFILVYRNRPIDDAIAQERYWEGGNRNEVVVCIGIDDQNRIDWAYDFSWTDRQDFKVETKSFIIEQKKLDLSALVDFLNTEIKQKWKDKDFKDFDYLSVQPTGGQLIWIVISILIINGLVGWWIVANEHEH